MPAPSTFVRQFIRYALWVLFAAATIGFGASYIKSYSVITQSMIVFGEKGNEGRQNTIVCVELRRGQVNWMRKQTQDDVYSPRIGGMPTPNSFKAFKIEPPIPRQHWFIDGDRPGFHLAALGIVMHHVHETDAIPLYPTSIQNEDELIEWILLARDQRRTLATTTRRVDTWDVRVPLLWIIAILAIGPILHVRKVRHSRERRRRLVLGRCVICSYDLRGSVGRCPECGATISAGNVAPVSPAQCE